MSGEIRPVTGAALKRLYREELARTFPRAERRPFFAIRRLAGSGQYDTLGLYRGDLLLAYAFLWREARSGWAMLDYLAVCQDLRGQGIGSAFLAGLQDRYRAQAGIFVEVEAPLPGLPPEEEALRQRRLAFYRRAGFGDLAYRAQLFGVTYAMLAWPGNAQEQAVMRAHRALYLGQGRPGPWQRQIQIPAQPSSGTGGNRERGKKTQ